MKKLTKILFINITLFMLVGCVGNTSEESTADSSENRSVLDLSEGNKTETDANTSTSELEESYTDDSNDISSDESVKIDLDSTSSENRELNVGDKEDKELLSQYSSKQIEYARIWLQLGPNQEIDELNIRQFPAGEPINPNDDTSAKYSEDVIQLAGSRLVDGSVTYSGNGDGTINVYNVPLRWDGKYPAGEKFYTDIIENTKLVYVNLGNDDKIVELIKLQK
ncbi:hypothetical protein ACFVAD_15550 [Sutcliffiella sp. NPDC057660]|uniref:hypothetical protein n=1 Tax=Sutcliffiella sp. NPDC057660 TaxID=3346199 RepID=UPI003698E5B8